MSELMLEGITFTGCAVVVYSILFVLSNAFFSEEAKLQKRLEGWKRLAPTDINRAAHDLLKNERSGDPLFLRSGIFSRLPLWFEQAGMQVNTSAWLLCVVILAVSGALAGWLLSHQALAVFLGSALLGSAPVMWVSMRRKRRMAQFESHLAQSLEILGRSLRAGHPMTVGLQMIGQEMPDPIRTEFSRVFHEQQMGLPLEESLRNMARRVPLVDLRFFVIAVLIHRQTGGDLAEILDNLSNVIRERFKVQGQVRALTAEGRLSGWVLSLLPVLVFALIRMINPGYASLLFEHELGRRMMYTAVVMLFIGVLFIKKIVNIKV